MLKSKKIEVQVVFNEAEEAKRGYLDKLHSNEVLLERMRESNAEHATRMKILKRKAVEDELVLRQKFADEIEQLKKYRDVDNWKERFTLMKMLLP